jgi:hypothetical protein
MRVIAGLVPAIRGLGSLLDGRDKAGDRELDATKSA